MQRRSLLLLTPLLPLSFFVSRYFKVWTSTLRQPIDYREQAQRLNQLASGIQTPADARTFVDFLANIFSEQLPPSSVSSTMREKVAQAEFASVSNPQKLIPEWRVVEAWNIYAQTIQAPRECQVTDAEVHNLRDAFLTTARLSWERGSRNIWSVPAIYATRADGGIAAGCRAIEAIRVFWDLANMPDNLASTRVRVTQGVLTSDLFRKALEHPSTMSHRGHVSIGPATLNPVEIAEREYIAKNGVKTFGKALDTMLDQALA
jgi:hypothetical protein